MMTGIIVEFNPSTIEKQAEGVSSVLVSVDRQWRYRGFYDITCRLLECNECTAINSEEPLHFPRLLLYLFCVELR